MRGEHVSEAAQAIGAFGSSPHARGTRCAPSDRRPRRRFIPACAGNTSRCPPPPDPRSVHPRMRGEHGRRIPRARFTGGSSPHARGTLRRGIRRAWRVLFIPACAGNTWWPQVPRSPATVHPRMRGEHRGAHSAMPSATGSSPHARGTHAGAANRRGDRRFIPACAGNNLAHRASAELRRCVVTRSICPPGRRLAAPSAVGTVRPYLPRMQAALPGQRRRRSCSIRRSGAP